MAPKPDGGGGPGGNWGGVTDTEFPWFDLNDFKWPTDILTTELGISELKPWVMNQRTLRIANNPTIIAERGSCSDSEHGEVFTQMRH